MKKNLNVQLTDTKGKELPNKVNEYIVEALMANTNDDRSTGEQKFKRYQLAMKVAAEGETDLLPEEMTVIKEFVGKVYGPLIVGQVFEILNNDVR